MEAQDGVTASFSPASTSANSPATLTLSTTVNSPPGTYIVTVTATNNSVGTPAPDRDVRVDGHLPATTSRFLLTPRDRGQLDTAGVELLPSLAVVISPLRSPNHQSSDTGEAVSWPST
jgi:hypothetical protein